MMSNQFEIKILILKLNLVNIINSPDSIKIYAYAWKIEVILFAYNYIAPEHLAEAI